jgi:hypothetical protein
LRKSATVSAKAAMPSILNCALVTVVSPWTIRGTGGMATSSRTVVWPSDNSGALQLSDNWSTTTL